MNIFRFSNRKLPLLLSLFFFSQILLFLDLVNRHSKAFVSSVECYNDNLALKHDKYWYIDKLCNNNGIGLEQISTLELTT